MELVITIIAFIILFGVLIFVHELGHFIVAKRNGIKVEEFAFGLPLLPRLLAIKRGETTYSVYPVPLGGFVRMLGEDGESTSKRSFARKSAGVRARVLLAGVAMNFLLGYVLLTVGFLLQMPPLVLCAKDYPGATFQNTVTVASVADGPAKQAGMQPGDQITAIAGQSIECQRDVSANLAKYPGQPTSVSLIRGGQPVSVTVTPAPSGQAGAGKIGIAPQDSYQQLRYPWYAAPLYAAMETAAISVATLLAIGGVFAQLLTTATVPDGISGPVGIARLTGEVVGMGLVVIVRFVAIISISLAVFNLLPIPALDGGRLLFVIIEKMRGGRPVTARLENAIHAGGFAFLIAFILVITYFDLTR